MHVSLWRLLSHGKFSHDVCLLKRWCATWVKIFPQGTSRKQDASADRWASFVLSSLVGS